MQFASSSAHSFTIESLHTGEDVEDVRLVACVHTHWIAETAQFVLKSQLVELVKTAHVLQFVDAVTKYLVIIRLEFKRTEKTSVIPSNKIASNVEIY